MSIAKLISAWLEPDDIETCLLPHDQPRAFPKGFKANKAMTLLKDRPRWLRRRVRLERAFARFDQECRRRVASGQHVVSTHLGALTDLVLPQEGDDSLSVATESSPYRSTPIVDCQVTFRPRRCRQHIDDRHGAPIHGQIYRRPLSFSTSKLHVCFLDLTARKMLFNAEIKANQTEYNTDRLAGVVRGLNGESIHHVLQDKSGAAHRVGVHLIVCSTLGVHIEKQSTERSEHLPAPQSWLLAKPLRTPADALPGTGTT